MTDKYAVIGNPISHSKSPDIHRMFADQFKGQSAGDITYERIEAPLDGFAAKIEELRTKGYKGCNVTVPFKFEAFKIATQLTERAQAAQAVNTLKFDGEIILGDNTDGAGLVRDIEQNLKFTLQGRDVLLLGAGGAAAGVSLPVLETGANVHIFNRTTSKAQALSDAFLIFLNRNIHRGYGLPSFIRSGTELSNRQFLFVINATSAGLTDSEIPLPETIFAPGALAYDMMYGRETPFMRFAREHGAQVADGLGMLVEQAAEAFRIWRGHDLQLDTAAVIRILKQPA